MTGATVRLWRTSGGLRVEDHDGRQTAEARGSVEDPAVREQLLAAVGAWDGGPKRKEDLARIFAKLGTVAA